MSRIYALVLYILTPSMITKGTAPQQIVISETLTDETVCKDLGNKLTEPWKNIESSIVYPVCYPGPDTRTPEQKEAEFWLKHPNPHPKNIGGTADPVKIVPVKEPK